MHRELWESWEDEVAEALDADKVKASGRTFLHKGDCKTCDWLVDAKETRTDGYAVSESFWRELASWARNEGKEPAIAVRIENDSVFEIAVVTEIAYAERHPDYVPDDQLKKQKQKKVTAKMAGKKPSAFQVGPFRLVAYSFDEFCKDVVG